MCLSFYGKKLNGPFGQPSNFMGAVDKEKDTGGRQDLSHI